jgi:transaldolase/glucose-6-phosphate isomerase
MTAHIDRQSFSLPRDLTAEVDASLREWSQSGKVRRLWARDVTLWTGADEASWLGWLGVTRDQLAHRRQLTEIREETRDAGFTHALVLGMGGSSLCPEVMSRTFGPVNGHPELLIVDSTDPAQIRAAERRVDFAKTIFIVSSKSGTTLEPNIFKQYFFERVAQVVGHDRAGERFIAITDPDSKLEQAAKAAGFRRVFFGVPEIGGRYSALSNFGMVPTAVMGVDVPSFLERAETMVEACASGVPPEENPGVVLGTILGVLASNGRDKVTLVTSPGIEDFGAWLEQLLAESTGKQGRGLIPVDRESLGPPEVYGDDRLFVYTRLESAPASAQDETVAALERAGHPVVRIPVDDAYDLGQEFFRWEIATAVAGSIMGINPFDQPDVEASKLATRALTEAFERTGSLPVEEPLIESDGMLLFADAKNAAALGIGERLDGRPSKPSLAEILRAHLDRLTPGDYFALLAYVEMSPQHEEELQALRLAVRNAKRVATCLGFGPRFLHSTGQAYKGGPNTGVFLQITCSDAVDLPVPGQRYTFGVVKAAQARGDLQVLVERKRRALRVHLGPNVVEGLRRLRTAAEEALALRGK